MLRRTHARLKNADDGAALAREVARAGDQARGVHPRAAVARQHRKRHHLPVRKLHAPAARKASKSAAASQMLRTSERHARRAAAKQCCEANGHWLGHSRRDFTNARLASRCGLVLLPAELAVAHPDAAAHSARYPRMLHAAPMPMVSLQHACVPVT